MTNMTKSNGRAIIFTKNHIIDQHIADCIQLSEIMSQLYDLMSMIESIRMDNNEFVALKVLILLSPGMPKKLFLYIK